MLNLLLAIGLSFLFGILGGGILAGPFWLFGVIAGPMYAVHAGVVIGAVAWVRRWQTRSVWIACLSEFFGALLVGYGTAWVFAVGPPDYAVIGQIGGTLLGMVLAEVCKRPQVDPIACQECGYSLRGNVSGVCPECGQAVPSDQMKTLNEQDYPPKGDVTGKDGR